MGTHPIFESDFDCLTEWLGVRRRSIRCRQTSRGTKRLKSCQPRYPHARRTRERVIRQRNAKCSTKTHIGTRKIRLYKQKVFETTLKNSTKKSSFMNMSSKIQMRAGRILMAKMKRKKKLYTTNLATRQKLKRRLTPCPLFTIPKSSINNSKRSSISRIMIF